ncbi:glycoside hydrolase family 6 protein [Nonomuraea terrae]|nr:glycoside hydrolase family 6 protein [Nonomuraea terrae]
MEELRDGDPRRVGPYTLLGRLGEGGMGVVYLGQGPDGARAAVKLLHARMDADPDFRRRFAREVAAARRVARFCTAPVLDADVHGEVVYLVTEYVEGPSLGQAVRASGPLRGSALDGLAAATAMALRAVHGAGVVHRDLKPSNVLLSQVGPKVIDFGIAQLMDAEMSSTIVGTPAYMSPEQARGGEVGPASDIFSWGCTVAFAAGGAPPFGTGPVPAVLARIVNAPPELSGLSGPLLELVVAALAKNPAERPTAQELMDRLSFADPSVLTSATPGTTGTSGTGLAASVEAGVPPAATAGAGGKLPGADTAEGSHGLAGLLRGPRRKVLAGTVAVLVAAAGVSAALAWRDESAPTSTATSTATSAPTDAPTDAASPTGPDDGEAPQRPVAGRNPLRIEEPVTFYAPPEPGASRQAELWNDERPDDAELMRRLAAVPHAIRLDQTDARPEVAQRLTEARQAGGVPVFLVNHLPGGDCRPATPADREAYQEWITGVARQIGQAEAVVILEPSSLVNLPGTENCDPGGSAQHRYDDLRRAVRTLKSNPATAVYLDGSQADWPGTAIMAERLIGAGIEAADGFFLNTAAFQTTEKSVGYGKELSACVAVRRATGRAGCPADVQVDPAAMPHFVVDTARNGRGSWAPDKRYKDPQVWCNPPGRGVGERPTTETGEELVDAYLWIARPGTSGGRCRRGTDGELDPERGVVAPPAGEWWPELALERAENAEPPLR